MSSSYLWVSLIETVKCYALSGLLAFGIIFISSSYINHTLLFCIGGTLFLMTTLAPIVTKWIPKERVSPDRKAVFVSGCDRGFGYMLAQKLDDLGFHVFAGCLFPEGDGAANLRKSGSSRLHTIGLDVTSDISVHEACAYVRKNLEENVLWAVVNNAGIVDGSDLHWTKTETIQKVINVNTLGVLRVTKAFLPELKKSKGRVVTVASLAGRYDFPGGVPYCMSKKAAIVFCDGLRLEMYKWNVQVITIEPSLYRTAILTECLTENVKKSWENAPKEIRDMYSPDYTDQLLKKISFVSKYFSKHPAEVVSSMEEAITALYPEYSYSTGNFLSLFVLWVLPRIPKPVADMLIIYGSASVQFLSRVIRL